MTCPSLRLLLRGIVIGSAAVLGCEGELFNGPTTQPRRGPVYPPAQVTWHYPVRMPQQGNAEPPETVATAQPAAVPEAHGEPAPSAGGKIAVTAHEAAVPEVPLASLSPAVPPTLVQVEARQPAPPAPDVDAPTLEVVFTDAAPSHVTKATALEPSAFEELIRVACGDDARGVVVSGQGDGSLRVRVSACDAEAGKLLVDKFAKFLQLASPVVQVEVYVEP
jgi:hypothetical protein